MADTPETPQPNGAAGQNGATPPQMVQRVLAQFTRDLSFENIMSRKGVQGEVQPEIAVQVNLDAHKRDVDHQFEVVSKLSVSSKNKVDGATLFLMELEYVGVFHIEGIPEEQMHPYLLIECPRTLFPFMRRIVSDVTRDGGFPPLNLEQIDWVQLYRNELARRAQAQKAAPASDDTAEA